MPRPKKAKGAGKDETTKAVGLTQEEREALAKGVPATGPVVKMGGQDGTDVGSGIDGIVTVTEDEDVDIRRIVVDESHLSTEEKVGRLAQLYRRIAKMQLVIGLWVLLNVFRNSQEEARSKDPQKQNSFNAICSHPDLPEDLKGDTLRRYVFAAVTMKELRAKGVAVELLDYSHFRVISTLPDEATREKVARMVIEKTATARQTEGLVSIELEKAKLERSKPKADSDYKDNFSPLAVEIIGKLDDPEGRIIWDKKIMSILLDPIQARAKFNFREQTKIYDKAERVLKKKTEEKSNLEKAFATNEANMKFLEDLMDAFDSGSVTTETK